MLVALTLCLSNICCVSANAGVYGDESEHRTDAVANKMFASVNFVNANLLLVKKRVSNTVTEQTQNTSESVDQLEQYEPCQEQIEYVSAKSGLNIRTGASTERTVLGTAKYNESVSVVGVASAEGWVYVKYNSVCGFVLKSYLSETQAEVEESESESVSDISLDDDNDQSQTTDDETNTEDDSDSYADEENDSSGYTGGYLGTFKLTFYCNCSICCGEWAGGATASGTYPTAGRTIAVDPDVIPLGSQVIINGHTYVAEDTGSSIVGNRIDVYMDSHEAALDAGVQYAEVYLAY